MMGRPAVVLTDIEGTTTPISFVHRTLFPFARARLPAFLETHAANPAVSPILAEVRALAPGHEPLDTLLGWMDADAKITPLKELQGLIWREGYACGALQAEIYPDVPRRLEAWHAGGVRLAVYSSGSVEAQKQLFGHTRTGDLTGLFAGFFDTRIGAKRDTASYAAIAAELAVVPDAILFLSDVEAELDAAEAAGLGTCQLVRNADGTTASTRHRVAPNFLGVARIFDLP